MFGHYVYPCIENVWYNRLRNAKPKGQTLLLYIKTEFHKDEQNLLKCIQFEFFLFLMRHKLN